MQNTESTLKCIMHHCVLLLFPSPFSSSYAAASSSSEAENMFAGAASAKGAAAALTARYSLLAKTAEVQQVQIQEAAKRVHKVHAQEVVKRSGARHSGRPRAS